MSKTPTFARRWLARWGGCTGGDKIYRLRDRIKDDMHFTAVELAYDVRDFLLERILSLPVVRALAQHEGFDDAPQQVRGECRVRNYNRIVRLVIQMRDSS